MNYQQHGYLFETSTFSEIVLRGSCGLDRLCTSAESEIRLESPVATPSDPNMHLGQTFCVLYVSNVAKFRVNPSRIYNTAV
jgi:hypothetical protein